MTPITIPFTKGQTEGVDKAIMPSGFFRQVYNLRIDREGRLVPRPKLESKTRKDQDGNLLSNTLQAFCEPDGVITDETNWDRFVFQWVYDEDIQGERLVSRGRLPSDTSTELFYAADATTPVAIRAAPQVGIDREGRLVVAYLAQETPNSVGTIVIEIRDQYTYKVLKTQFFSLPFNTPTTTKNIVMCLDPLAQRGAIVYKYTISGPENRIGVLLFSTVDPYPAINQVTIASGSGLNIGPDTLDAASFTDDSSFMVAYRDGATNLVLERRSFIDASLISQLDSTGTYDDPPRIGVASVSVNGRWRWGFGGTTNLYLRSGLVAGGGLVTRTETGTELSAPGLFAADNNVVSLVYSDYDLSAGSIKTTRAAWSDGSGNTLSIDGVFENTAMVTQPVQYRKGSRESGGRSHFAAEVAYVSPDDTELRFQPSGRVDVINATTVSGSALRGGALHVLPDIADCRFNFVTPPKPVLFLRNGKQYTIWPLETGNRSALDSVGFDSTFRELGVVWAVSVCDWNKGVSLRRGESLIPGGRMAMVDGAATSAAGFSGPPHAAEGDFDESGTVLVSATFEYTDANGRLWRSAPATVRTLVDATSFVKWTAPKGIMGDQNGCTIVFYASDVNGTVLYRRASAYIAPGSSVTWTIANLTANSDEAREPLYTQTGELGNDAPPPCQFLTRTRSRVWAGGLERPSAIQASKVLNEFRGVEWSDSDAFQVILPDECTGLATMDDSVIAFTRKGVYMVNGSGPNASGIGSFTDPQAIPTTTGCINHRSVVVGNDAVFFQSERGIEAINRGFSSPVWIGQPVRDTLKEYPVCIGGVASPQDSTIRWLFVDREQNPTKNQVIVYDERAKTWYLNEWPNDPVHDRIAQISGTRLGIEDVRMCLGSSDGVQHIDIEDTTLKFTSTDEGWLETGEIRPTGIGTWMYGRRASLKGVWGGLPCTVSLEFAFDDQAFLPQDRIDWVIDEANGYTEGQHINLEVSLPVQLFSSVRFRMRLSGQDLWEDKYTFNANGITVWFQGTGAGPRVSSRDKG